MQHSIDQGATYVPLRPKTNEDHCCKQVALHINVCPVNQLSMRRICLSEVYDCTSLQNHRRRLYGHCGVNCNQCHNLSSTLALLPINLRIYVDDTVHWARQNYEKDHEANVRGLCCGCGRPWTHDMTLHSLTECGWMKSTGDVIHANYDKDVNFALNRTKSYCELAIKTTC